MRSSFMTAISVFIGCIVVCRAADDIAATTLTVTSPAPATGKFLIGTAVSTTFTLTFTLTGTVTPTDVKVYFSNADGSIKSTEVTAGGSNAPDGSTDASGTTYTDLTASLTFDATNCAAYTKLCASITVTDDDTSNNEACADFGTGNGEAGTNICTNDIEATTLTVTLPAPATSVFYIGTDVETTFTLAYTVTDSGGSPSDVKVYFSNAAGTTTSTEVIASGGINVPDGSPVTSAGNFGPLTVTLRLDAANCAAYTKVCSSITVTDANAANNVACADFGTGIEDVGSKNCTVVQVTTEPPTTDSSAGILSMGLVSIVVVLVASVLF